MDERCLGLVLAENGGVIARRRHPELGGSLDWLVRRGRLVAVLPGVYTPPDLAPLPLTRMWAACSAHPDGVLTAGAAARLAFWPAAPLPVVQLASPAKIRAQPGFEFRRRQIPPELVDEAGGLRWTAPALTALELASVDDAEAIDVVLRSRRATLTDLQAALRATPGRRGNHARQQVLLDSRDEPWSEAERRGHRLLRAAGISGWRANLPVTLDERLYYLDIAFRRQRLAIEIDGRIHERDLALFESDRWRQNALVRAGWRVLRFTWRMLVEHPEQFVHEVRTALRMYP